MARRKARRNPQTNCDYRYKCGGPHGPDRVPDADQRPDRPAGETMEAASTIETGIMDGQK
jgi:hypothetical protein